MGAMLRRSLLLSGAVGLVAGTGLRCSARAQGARSWPQRPVRLLVPYAPGGGTDVFARALAEGLRPILGQPVLVENRAGANGVVGSEVVSRAEPDGHLFLVDTGSHTLNPYVMPSLPYQTAPDFAPVALLSRVPMLHAAGAATPYTTVAELIAAARAAPWSIGFCTSDAAISYAGNLFARLAGIEMVEVSYRGAAPMLNDLIAGHLPTSWNSTVAALPHLKAGRIRALGATRPRAARCCRGCRPWPRQGWPATSSPAGTACSARSASRRASPRRCPPPSPGRCTSLTSRSACSASGPTSIPSGLRSSPPSCGRRMPAGRAPRVTASSSARNERAVPRRGGATHAAGA